MACLFKIVLPSNLEVRIWKTFLCVHGHENVGVTFNGPIPPGISADIADMVQAVYEQGREDEREDIKKEFKAARDTLREFMEE